MEILYTVTPVVVVAALFGISVATQLKVTNPSNTQPALVVDVTGFQWGWRFDFPEQHVTVEGSGEVNPPTIDLPVDRPVHFVLRTKDVNHAFWVPQFLEKKDLIQGIDNSLDITPTTVGEFDGKCAEFCGLDHWRMPFTLRVVNQGDFDAWVRSATGGRTMTVVDERPVEVAEPEEPAPPSRGLLAFLTTTDHKRIGGAYMVTAFVFFLIGGSLAEVIRVQLYSPQSHVVSETSYNQLFTMHGSIMMFLFLGPFAFGLANYLVPIQIGARDMAFPRLNAMSYWFYLFGGITMLGSFLTADGAADFGWTGYAPLSEITHSPTLGGDLWIMALVLTGLSGVLTGVNIVPTVLTMRAPGMTMFRMPIFTWNMLVTSILVLIAFPVLTAAAAMLFADRHLGGHIFDPAGGRLADPVAAPVLVLRPPGGVHPRPAVLRRDHRGHPGVLVAAGVRLRRHRVRDASRSRSLSVGVWAHHMFTTGAAQLSYFAGVSMLIAVPTGVKFFNWIGTMWGGQIVYRRADAVRDRLPAHVPHRRHHRRACSRRRRSTSRSPTRTSSSPTCTTCCSADRCSRCTPASTTGSRSSPAGSSTSGSGQSTSG